MVGVSKMTESSLIPWKRWAGAQHLYMCAWGWACMLVSVCAFLSTSVCQVGSWTQPLLEHLGPPHLHHRPPHRCIGGSQCLGLGTWVWGVLGSQVSGPGFGLLSHSRRSLWARCCALVVLVLKENTLLGKHFYASKSLQWLHLCKDVTRASGRTLAFNTSWWVSLQIWLIIIIMTLSVIGTKKCRYNCWQHMQ